VAASVPYPKALERFPVIRQSALSVFDNCALSSQFSTEHEQGWTSHPAARGQIVHRTIARCLEWMEETGNESMAVDVDRAMAIFDDVVRQADVPVDGNPLGDEVVTIPLREVAQARITVKTWALYTRWSVKDFAGIEKRIEIVVPYPDGSGGVVQRTLTTKPDLLLITAHGEHAIVVDWKDTWGIPGEKQADYAEDTISEEGYFQQRFHALVVFRRYPRVKHVTLREFYPRYASGTATDRKGKPINPVREATIDRAALPDIEAEMSALVERFDRAYETGVFRPAPGSHCSYCSRPEACTIFPSARGVGRISSPEEAERLAGRLNVLKALQKQTTGALRSWSKAHGDVAVKDAKRPRVYGPVVRLETRKPDAEAVKAALLQGRDPAELYVTREVEEFCVHSPEEEHPFAKAAREEEERLLAMERAAAERKGARRAS